MCLEGEILEWSWNCKPSQWFTRSLMRLFFHNAEVKQSSEVEGGEKMWGGAVDRVNKKERKTVTCLLTLCLKWAWVKSVCMVHRKNLKSLGL